MAATTLQDATTHPMVLATHELLAAMQEEFRIRRADRDLEVTRWNQVVDGLAGLVTMAKAHRDAAAGDLEFYQEMVGRLNAAAAALVPGEH